MAHDAALRNLAVIGEAVKSLPEDFTHEHLGTPLPSIAGLCNVVVPEEFRVTPTRGQPMSVQAQYRQERRVDVVQLCGVEAPGEVTQAGLRVDRGKLLDDHTGFHPVDLDLGAKGRLTPAS